MANNLSGISYTSNFNNLDGLSIVDADVLYIDGVPFDPTTVVPYVGANKEVDLNSQNIKTTHNAVAGPDLVNLTTLQAAIAYVDAGVAASFLNKVTTNNQTVTGNVQFNGGVTFTQNTVCNTLQLQSDDNVTMSWTTSVSNGTPNDLTLHAVQTGNDIVFRDTGVVEATGVKITGATALRAVVTDANKNLATSATTATEIGYLSGVTSGVQSQINALVPYTGANQLLNMGSFLVRSSAVPIAGQDLCNKTYVDGKVSSYAVAKAGDTMTGALLMGTNKITSSYVPVDNVDLTNKLYVNNYAVAKAGDTMTGTLLMGTNKITSSYVPADNVDLTNKLYVDNAVSGSGSKWTLSGANIYNNNAGNVGIGTTGPGYNLDVFNSSNPSIMLRPDATNYLQSGVATGAGAYSTSAVGGDGVIRVGTTKKLHLLAGTGGAVATITSSKMGVNLPSPYYTLHPSNLATWSTTGQKAAGILGIGGANDTTDGQSIVFPNPSINDNTVPGMYWWSADFYLTRYKNDFYMGFKECHGAPLGSAYKDIMRASIYDSGGYQFLSQITMAPNGGNVGIGLTNPGQPLSVYRPTQGSISYFSGPSAFSEFGSVSTANFWATGTVAGDTYMNWGTRIVLGQQSATRPMYVMDSSYGQYSWNGFVNRNQEGKYNIFVRGTPNFHTGLPAWQPEEYLLIGSGYDKNSGASRMAAGFHAWSQGIATYAIGALYPTVTWCDLALYAAQTRVYFNYALCAYTVAGGWVNISDEREKEDIQDLKTSRSLERIMALKPKHYRRIYRNGTTPVPDKVKEARLVGFLAQDVLKTNPHCVSTWQNQEAKTDDDDGVRFGICYNDYITHLVGAVQEQQKQIQIQQEKMDALIARDKVIVEHARQLEEDLKTTKEDLKTTKEDLKTTKDAFSSYREMTDARINKLASLVAQLIK